MNDVLVFLVAHPKKMSKTAAGKTEVPSLYVEKQVTLTMFSRIKLTTKSRS